MKRISLSLLYLAVFSISAASAAEITIKNSEVNKVLLYRTGAEVTRSAVVTVPAGNSTLLLQNLSPYLDPATIAVEGRSGSKALILGVSHRYDYTGPDKMLPEVAQLQDSLEVLTRKRQKVNSQLSVYQEEQNLLLANKTVGGSNTGTKTEDLRSMAAFYRERLTELKDKMLDLSDKEKDLAKEITKISQQIEELKNRRNPPANTSTVLIDVSSATESRLTLEIRYFTGQASWNPSYDIRVPDLSSQVSIELKAEVLQDTWEKWDNVQLVISTGNVSSGNAKPELVPWYVNFMKPVMTRQKQMGVAQPAASPESPAVMLDVQESAMGNTAAWTTSAQTAFATEYEITLPYSIPSDGKPHMVQVQQYKLKAAYKYHAIPKLDPDVFLVAHVTGWQDLGLLSGPAGVYYQGAYVGASQINVMETEDTLQVSLGRDPAIVVSRDKIKDVEGNRIMGGNRVKEYRYEIKLKNTRKEAVSIVLEDQLPISMDKDIEVKATELSGAEPDAATGELKWNVDIAPGQQVTKILGFTVKYPRDKQIWNL